MWHWILRDSEVRLRPNCTPCQTNEHLPVHALIFIKTFKTGWKLCEQTNVQTDGQTDIHFLAYGQVLVGHHSEPVMTSLRHMNMCYLIQLLSFNYFTTVNHQNAVHAAAILSFCPPLSDYSLWTILLGAFPKCSTTDETANAFRFEHLLLFSDDNSILPLLKLFSPTHPLRKNSCLKFSPRYIYTRQKETFAGFNLRLTVNC